MLQRIRFQCVVAAALLVGIIASRSRSEEPPWEARSLESLRSAEASAGAVRESASGDPVSTWLDETRSSSEPSGRVLQRRRSRGSAAEGEKASLKVPDQSSAFGMFWPLCVVLTVLGLCVYGIRRWMPRTGRLGGGGAIKVLSRQHLSSRQSLCLVRLGRRLVLMGITPDRISTLCDIGNPHEDPSVEAAEERGRPGSFTSMFRKLSAREMATAEEVEHGEVAIEAEPLVVSESLMQTRGRVRDLVHRVRDLSSGLSSSAEST